MRTKSEKRPLIFLFIIIFFFLSIYSAYYIFYQKNQVKNENEGKIKAVASIFPVYDILRQIGGEKIEVILLLPAGASPHTFESSPQMIKNIQTANLFFFVGAKLDTWANKIVEDNINLDNVNYVATDLSSKVKLKPLISDNKDYYLEDVDPHYWLSPENVYLIASAISEELSTFDLENAAYYQENLNKFKEKLAAKEITWQAKINSLDDKNIIVFHDAWQYFADYFNLNIVATFEPFPGKSPSPKYLEKIQEKITVYNISTLFIEPQLSPDLARSMAQNLLTSIETLDPLGGSLGREDYFSLMDYNINTIYSALNN